VTLPPRTYFLFFNGGSCGVPRPGGASAVLVAVDVDAVHSCVVWSASMAHDSTAMSEQKSGNTTWLLPAFGRRSNAAGPWNHRRQLPRPPPAQPIPSTETRHALAALQHCLCGSRLLAISISMRGRDIEAFRLGGGACTCQDQPTLLSAKFTHSSSNSNQQQDSFSTSQAPLRGST
jgi:hypothetical protein